MQQLSLRLRKLEQLEGKESSDEASKPTASSAQGTQNSTPTTVEERNSKRPQGQNDPDLESPSLQNECRLEDLFNSDEDISDDDDTVIAKRRSKTDFSEFSKRYQKKRRTSQI